MSNITIFHNPRCSKSRETLALLESNLGSNNQDFDVIEYLKTPPNIDLLCQLAEFTGVKSLHDLVRVKEPIYKELEITADITDKALAKLIVEQPKLLERPIVIKGNKAIIGRPPENVLDLIS